MSRLKPQASELGAVLGKEIYQIGREPYDLDYQKRRKEDINTLLSDRPIRKYFIKRHLITSAKLIEDIDNKGFFHVQYNNEPKLTIPVAKGFSPVAEDVIGDILRSEESLENVFFADEEDLADLVTTLNQRTISAIDRTVAELLDIQQGLKMINAETKRA